MTLKAIDLFAGCGGFSCGFIQAGFVIDTAVEFDKSIAASYQHNHPGTLMLAEDIKNVDNSKYFHRDQADVIIGGPPCQGFSTAGARNRHYFVDDPRNYLFKHYLNIVKLVKPKVFIFENVKGIVHYQKGEIFREIEKAFRKEGYKLQHIIVKASDFGVPQARERTILIGSLFDFDLYEEIKQTKNEILSEIPTFFNRVTVWDAIGNMPSPSITGQIKSPIANNEYTKYIAATSDKIFNHIATKHANIAVSRMKKVKQKENFSVLKENIKSVHSGAYGRLAPTDVAATITTRFDTPSGGRFTHPYKNRTITPREAARLQSFPDSFEFLGNKTSICKQIGNAVPPKLAYFFARLLKRLLHNDS